VFEFSRDEMNLAIVDDKEIDHNKWSHFIENHHGGSIFQTPEFFQVCQGTKRYEPYFLAAVDKSVQIQALLLAVFIKEFGGPCGRISSRSIIQGAPLFLDTNEGKSALKFLMTEYDKTAKRKALYSQIRNLTDVTESQSMFQELGYAYEGHLNYILDLDKSEDELFAALSKERRYGVRKCSKAGVSIVEIRRADRIEGAYSLLQQTYSTAGLPLADVSLFESAIRLLGPKNMIRVFLAEKDGVPASTIMLLIYKGVIYDWYAGASKEHLNLCPNDLVTWHAIRYGLESKASLFDFGGAGKPGEHYGVREFKKQFGGRMVNYGRFIKIHNPRRLRIAEKGFQILRKFR
jgi:lipid II:glycine glycyltransferase (peptidoglycan interpeptide bridge formation enzyme)